ncbi:MAG: hypothetical protein RL266_2490 [Bacteroidota bacterium]|jgi:choice-of-anchor B domain-containing protein
MNSLKNLLTLALVCGFNVVAQSQTTLNTTQLGHLSYSLNLSEVRGALHNGREYALVGVNNGFSIVDVQDPTNPTEVYFEQGASSIWRDPFYHNGHAYCVTEGGGGLLIVDMSPLPGSTNLPTTLYTGTNIPWSSAHNMFIDTENDKAYIFGSNNIDGVIILDISTPMAPVELGVWNTHYIHDGFVRGDTLWAACLEAGTFLIDVSTPSNPVVLANWITPSVFAHNVWPSDDNAFCYTTDEVESGFIAGYDMSNLQNVVETDKVQHPLSENVIPHNAHFMNDYVITSHYRDGLTIHDVSDPSNIVLTGYFDSSPLSGGGFNGSWGAWPYLPSGNILIADIEEGLFVVGPQYTRAARLEGTVTEFGTGTPLNDVQIVVLGANLNELTDIFGTYATGTATAGTYQVSFQKGGYLSQTISNVELINGQVELLDVQLVPEISFTLSGLVTEEGTNSPIEGATVRFVNNFFDIDFTSDMDGNYLDNAFFAGEYEVTVAAWGYVTKCMTVSVTENDSNIDFELEKGYYDDFALDMGWTVSGDAGAGLWERGEPIQTTFDASISNPGEDAEDDCGLEAYITGNSGGTAGNDDVDDEVTILTSPIMDLTGNSSPVFSFYYWFFNAGGSGSPNDSYVIKVSNGSTTATLGSLSPTNGDWTNASFFLDGQIAITDQMRMIIEVQDADPGHLVEGGFDLFKVLEGMGMNENSQGQAVSLYPNPNSGSFEVSIPLDCKKCNMNIYNLQGALVENNLQLRAGVNQIDLSQAKGVYMCEVIIDGSKHIKRLLVH